MESANYVGLLRRRDIKPFIDANVSHFERFTLVVVHFIILPIILVLIQSNRPNETESKQREITRGSHCLS